MNKYYLDISIIDNEEISKNSIINKLFSEIHLHLSSLKSQDIGISFPDNKIRAYGDLKEINKLVNYIVDKKGYNDYCKFHDAKPVPENHDSWIIVKRIQPKFSASKKRRMIKRGSDPKKLKSYEKINNKFLNVKSNSNGNNFKLFFDEINCDNNGESNFNNYGFGSPVPLL